jgi:hypothetical protein
MSPGHARARAAVNSCFSLREKATRHRSFGLHQFRKCYSRQICAPPGETPITTSALKPHRSHTLDRYACNDSREVWRDLNSNRDYSAITALQLPGASKDQESIPRRILERRTVDDSKRRPRDL